MKWILYVANILRNFFEVNENDDLLDTSYGLMMSSNLLEKTLIRFWYSGWGLRVRN